VETFDTNVLVRLLVRDDDEQCQRAEAAWRVAIAASGVLLPTVVLVELAWVLRSAYRFDRATIAAALGRLVDSAGVTLEDDRAARLALAAFAAGRADLSDYVILEVARSRNALPLHTFDERLAEAEGATTVR